MVRHQTVDAEDFGLRTPKLGNGSRLVGLWSACAKASFFGPLLMPIFFANLQGDGIISQWTER
jgi:hypothetical protein